MDQNQQARPQTGMEVIDDAGHFIGTVEHVEPDHFVVQKGFFFSNSHRIHNSAISDINDHEIRLRISREAALHDSPDENRADYPEHGEIVPEADNVEDSAVESGRDRRKH